MKKYQSSYAFKQIKKKGFVKKKSIWIFHMDFPSNLTPVIFLHINDSMDILRYVLRYPFYGEERFL